MGLARWWVLVFVLVVPGVGAEELTVEQVLAGMRTRGRDWAHARFAAIVGRQPDHLVARYWMAATAPATDAGRARARKELSAVLRGDLRRWPAWLGPWTRVRLGKLEEAAGRKAAAVAHYRAVLESELAVGPLAKAAREGLARLGARVTEPALTPAQMRADLRQLTEAVGRCWAYAEDKRAHFGVDPAALERLAIEELGARPGWADFAGALRRYVAGLRDGHAAVSVRGATRASRRWPFELIDAAEGVLVRRVRGDVDVRVGDRVLGVDGRAIGEVLTRAAAEVVSSTRGQQRLGALARARETDAARVRVRLLRAGTAREVEVATVAPRPRAPERAISWKRLDATTGYLRIPTFQPAPVEWARARTHAQREAALAPARGQLKAAFAALSGTRSLILDVRGNDGGTDMLGMAVAGYLLAPGSAYYTLRTRYSPELAALPGWKGHPTTGWGRPAVIRLPRSGVSRYRGRLIVLVDAACFSATDNLLACLDDLHPDVTFVGRPSGAGTGAPRQLVTLRHSKAKVTLCVMEVRSPAGRLIEGRGTRPDRGVRWTRADLIAGRDADLEAARALARAR